MNRHDAEDIADGGPLGGGPDRLVDRIQGAVDAAEDSAGTAGVDEGYSQGFEEGKDTGEASGDKTGRENEHADVVAYLRAEGHTDIATQIEAGLHVGASGGFNVDDIKK